MVRDRQPVFMLYSVLQYLFCVRQTWNLISALDLTLVMSELNSLILFLTIFLSIL